MRDLLLVDAQPGRVRLFREALAVYHERFLHLQARKDESLAEARAQVERARRASRALHGGLAARKARRQVRTSRGGDEVRLHVFPGKEEALKFLRREPPYEWAPRPAVVFTDLYLEEMSGPSIVKEVKNDPALQDLPIVVLCAGATRGQIREAWDAGSNAVVDVSGEPPGMLGQVAETLEFWLQEAAL